MKVLMTADAVGGVWTYAVELSRALSKHGVQVVLATMGPLPSAEQRAEAMRVPGLVCEALPCKLEWMHEPWEEVAQAGAWLRGLEARHAPDVIHLNGYAHATVAWRAPRLVVAHSCVYSWWEAVHASVPPEAPWAPYRRAVQGGLRAADAIVAPTRAMVETLARHYGPLPRPGIVIPNGRDAEQFAPLPKQPFAFCAGRLGDEAKNVADILEAARRGLDWPVVLAGEENPAASLPRGVHLLGRLPRPALRACYGRAGVFVSPARYEPFGLAALEAGLSGCALVLGDIPSLREVWGDAALFVPPGEPTKLRQALQRLARDPTQRERLARAAYRRALRYDADRMAAAYLSIYHRLLGGDDAPAGREESTCAS